MQGPALVWESTGKPTVTDRKSPLVFYRMKNIFCIELTSDLDSQPLKRPKSGLLHFLGNFLGATKFSAQNFQFIASIQCTVSVKKKKI